MQAISLLFHDKRSSTWDVKLGKRVVRHCLRILTRWLASNDAPTEADHHILSFRTSALMFTLTVIVKGNQLLIAKFLLSLVSKLGNDNELFQYANKCLRENNLLLHLIMQLSQVKIGHNGIRHIGETRPKIEV